MKLIKLFFLINTLNLFSQTYSLEWAKSIGGNLDVTISRSVVDSNNNIYVTGYFIGSIDFDPSPASYILTSPASTNNNNNDIFIAKYDTAGNLIWAKQLVGSGIADYSNSIELDSNENVYITGYFSQNVDFNPSPYASNSINVNGFPHAYLLKLDTNGNYLWAKYIESSYQSIGHKIKIHDNHIFLVGTFNGNADFDFSSNNFILNTNSTQEDGFLAKYNLDGDFIWAKKYGGINVGEILWGINFDSENNIYTTGYIRGFSSSGTTLIDGTTNVPFFGNDDILVIKSNESGDVIWAKSYGASNYDYAFGDVAIDPDNNIYISGKFRNSVDFNDDPLSTFNLYTYFVNGFLLKLNANGEFQNAIEIGGNGDNTSCLNSYVHQNQLYVVGKFSGTVDFDNSNNNHSLTSSGQEDLFILTLDFNLNFQDVKKISGSGNEFFGGLSFKNEKLYLCGSFNGTTNFDLLGGYNTISPVSNYDSFIAKYNLPLLGMDTSFTFTGHKIYPNPFSSSISVEASGLTKIEIYDILGKLQLRKNFWNENKLDIDLSHLINNAYYIKLTDLENSTKTYLILKK